MQLAPVVIQVSEFIVKSSWSCLSYCSKISAGKQNITRNDVEMTSLNYLQQCRQVILK